MNDSFDDTPRRMPLAPQDRPPAYPLLSALDRRRFLAACARAALFTGGVAILGGGTACQAQQPPPPPPPPPDDIPLAGTPPPPDWPEQRVRLIDEHPIEVTFRDGRSARLVVAIVRGEGPEPAVDRDALRNAVREVCAGFDGGALTYEDARDALEAALRARLDDILKASGSSVESVAVAEAPAEAIPSGGPSQLPRTSPPSGSGAPAPPAPSPAPAPSPPSSPPAPRGPEPLPAFRGRCLVHGDACPGHRGGR